MKKLFCIYGLYDSHRRQIAYVGASAGLAKRLLTHFAGRDKATRDWVKKVKAGGATIRAIVLEVATAESVSSREAYWICATRAWLNIAGTKLALVHPEFCEMPPSIYWRDGNRYFFSTGDAAKFFGVKIWRLRKPGGFFCDDLNKQIQLERL